MTSVTVRKRYANTCRLVEVIHGCSFSCRRCGFISTKSASMKKVRFLVAVQISNSNFPGDEISEEDLGRCGIGVRGFVNGCIGHILGVSIVDSDYVNNAIFIHIAYVESSEIRAECMHVERLSLGCLTPIGCPLKLAKSICKTIILDNRYIV